MCLNMKFFLVLPVLLLIICSCKTQSDLTKSDQNIKYRDPSEKPETPPSAMPAPEKPIPVAASESPVLSEAENIAKVKASLMCEKVAIDLKTGNGAEIDQAYIKEINDKLIKLEEKISSYFTEAQMAEFNLAFQKYLEDCPYK